MEVSFQSMPVNAGIRIAVLVQQSRQIRRGGRKVFDMEGHVFNQAGGPLFPHAAHRGEDTCADGPVLCHFGRVRREVYLHLEGIEYIDDGLYLLMQCFR